MKFSKTIWYFTNEAEQEEDPFISEEDVIEAEALYSKVLADILPEEGIKRLRELYSKKDGFL